jgi:UDP-glucose-4-epimerase GalE
MNVLVTGGAGYIGSHTARALLARGHRPIIFDNLLRGHREVPAILRLPFVEGDLLSQAELANAFADHEVDAVLHFAALAAVGESVAHPDLYYRNNVCGTVNLLDAMHKWGVSKLIFSSTCATYGDPIEVSMGEAHPQNPVNPYGRSKLMVERILADYASAHGLRFAALRYFNAAGCSSDGLLGEDHDPETHLIPRVLMAAKGELPHITVLGTDYDTPDGTCIRDYIHVEDLADAHVLALEHLSSGGASGAWNLGTGVGHSVREVIACAERASGRRIPQVDGPRRAGDPPRLVAMAEKVRRELGWTPRRTDLADIVASAWQWMEKGGRYRPRGR